ncbi:hypothetical protein, conserved [Eimeria maxima]|uniref:Uncharacterized protein n=1 Tax=Eimeria maxima TaxID=5804 RepID=U6MJA3_EIMMA|nr:hypothetical protein, conserved [Eimeria maxima]CDJ61735.1 hypothetical protein, conserved [Eimeria maxima]
MAKAAAVSVFPISRRRPPPSEPNGAGDCGGKEGLPMNYTMSTGGPSQQQHKQAQQQQKQQEQWHTAVQAKEHALSTSKPKPAVVKDFLSRLPSVYSVNEGSAADLDTTAAEETSRAAAATGSMNYSACVSWELQQLAADGELIMHIVRRLEALIACREEANGALKDLVAEQREELTKPASILSELRLSLERLRFDAASVRLCLSSIRQCRLLPPLFIVEKQQHKQQLQQELKLLLRLQQLEAATLAAESCSSSSGAAAAAQLPLQAALLMEAAALSSLSSSRDLMTNANLQPSLQQYVHETNQKLKRLLEGLKAALSCALQTAARSLPPPACGCGWRRPWIVAVTHQEAPTAAAAAATAAAGNPAGAAGKDTWSLYLAALGAYSLLPPSFSVGAAVSAAAAAAAAAATRQVLFAFVPADAAAFSEAEIDGVDILRKRLLLLPEPGACAATAAAAAAAAAALAAGGGGGADLLGLLSAGELAAAVAAADGVSCVMSVLGVLFDCLVGAEALSRWHAREGLRALQHVMNDQHRRRHYLQHQVVEQQQEHGENKDGCHITMPTPPTPGCCCSNCSSNSSSRSDCRREGNNSCCFSKGEAERPTVHQLAASAKERLRGLPSLLRLGLFLLQVRQQLLQQRQSLWLRLQQQLVEVLAAVPFSLGSAAAAADFVSLVVAVQQFKAAGDAFADARDDKQEMNLATAAAAAVTAAAAYAGEREAATSPKGRGATSRTDTDAAEAAVAADTAAAAAAAGMDAEASVPCQHTSSSTSSKLSNVLLLRAETALQQLEEASVSKLLQQLQRETWERQPVGGHLPLLLLQGANRPASSLLQRWRSFIGANIAEEAAAAGEGRAKMCSRCGEEVSMFTITNPFARWQPGRPFAAAGSAPTAHCGPSLPHRDGQHLLQLQQQQQQRESSAAAELAAIEMELSAAGSAANSWSKQRRLPVVVAATAVVIEGLQGSWGVAAAAASPAAAAAAVSSMLRLVRLYVAAVAAAALPPGVCGVLAGLQAAAPSGEGDRSKPHSSRINSSKPPALNTPAAATAKHQESDPHVHPLLLLGEVETFKRRLPHFCWLLRQTEKELWPLYKQLKQTVNNNSSSSGGGNETRGSRQQQQQQQLEPLLLLELVQPMSRQNSPGALWALPEKVAAVESAAEILAAVALQLENHGLSNAAAAAAAASAEPTELGAGTHPANASSLGHHQQQHQQPEQSVTGVLSGLSAAEKQHLVDSLATTRRALEDLRCLVYRIAAADVCCSSAFTAALKRAAADTGTEWPAAPAAAAGGVPTSGAAGADCVPPKYAAAIRQQQSLLRDVYWKLRCAGGGSIPLLLQQQLWRHILSQTISDAAAAFAVLPLPVDAPERCFAAGPLVAMAEALKDIIREANKQHDKAAAAAARAPAEAPADAARSALSPLDVEESDFDILVDVCSRPAAEQQQWCEQQQNSMLLLLPQLQQHMLTRLEQQGLLQR